jgi:hypothetical protein
MNATPTTSPRCRRANITILMLAHNSDIAGAERSILGLEARFDTRFR